MGFTSKIFSYPILLQRGTGILLSTTCCHLDALFLLLRRSKLFLLATVSRFCENIFALDIFLRLWGKFALTRAADKYVRIDNYLKSNTIINNVERRPRNIRDADLDLLYFRRSALLTFNLNNTLLSYRFLRRGIENCTRAKASA